MRAWFVALSIAACVSPTPGRAEGPETVAVRGFGNHPQRAEITEAVAEALVVRADLRVVGSSASRAASTDMIDLCDRDAACKKAKARASDCVVAKSPCDLEPVLAALMKEVEAAAKRAEGKDRDGAPALASCLKDEACKLALGESSAPQRVLGLQIDAMGSAVFVKARLLDQETLSILAGGSVSQKGKIDPKALAAELVASMFE